ncbi:hypothetical protein EYD10_14243 [Varanus komodoensis]|nr:hypothetical protein EYD10_14243 [Varanus komodoensis]
MKPAIRSTEQVAELVLLEHFITILPTPPRNWVQYQRPETLEEAIGLMENFVVAEEPDLGDRPGPPWQEGQRQRAPEGHGNRGPERTRVYGPVPTGRGTRHKAVAQLEVHAPGRGVSPALPRLTNGKGRGSQLKQVCFTCGKEGHFRRDCLLMECDFMEAWWSAPVSTTPQQAWRVQARVDGKEVEALVDTGCGRTLVRQAWGSPLEKILQVKGIHGDVKPYATRWAKVEVKAKVHLCQVGVVPSLAYEVVFGRDWPHFEELVREVSSEVALAGEEEVVGLTALRTSCKQLVFLQQNDASLVHALRQAQDPSGAREEHIMRKEGLDESPVGIKIAGRNINNLRYAEDTTVMAESDEGLKSLLMQVKEESTKIGLKLKIKKTKIMASSPLSSWQIDGEEMEEVTDCIFLGSKSTPDGDCNQEIKRRLLLGRKAVANLDSILNSRALTLPTKVHRVKATIVKTKLKYSGHLMRRKDSLEKSLMLETIDGKTGRRRQRMRWLDGVTGAEIKAKMGSGFDGVKEEVKCDLKKLDIKIDNMDGRIEELAKQNQENLQIITEVNTQSRFINENRFKDVWRELNGNQKRYTFYSNRHKNFTRINYISVTSEILSKIVNADIKVIKISDHAMITTEMEIKCDYRQANRWRIDLRVFKNEKILGKMEKELKEIWEINEKGGSNIIWDTMKAVFYENSNKNSKMLARAAQVKIAKNVIGVIKNEKGEICNKMKEKLLIFQRFFDKLYKGNEMNLKVKNI